MQLHENVPLSSLTTFKIGGSARYVAMCETEEDIQTAVALARDRGLPWYVLGGGSNILAADAGYEGVIIRPLLAELSFGDVASNGECVVAAGVGVEWNTLVQECVTRGLWGLENLAGIPGLIGGAPVQNIGAYGADVSETLLYVDTFDTAAGQVVRFTNAECTFGYRDSRFKHDSSLIILRTAFTLTAHGSPRTSYADLTAYEAAGNPLTTPEQIAEAVRAIRSKKFPDLRTSGTAGSFFKNPTITLEAYETLKTVYPGLPGFPVTLEGLPIPKTNETTQPPTAVKVPLAWILDHVLNVRGYVKGKARLFEKQPLVLTTEPGATAADVESLAQEIEARVFEVVGITIEREVRKLP